MGRKKRSSKAKKKAPMASEEPPIDEKAAAIESLQLSTSTEKEYAVEIYFETLLEKQLFLPVIYFIRHNIAEYAYEQWPPCIFLVKMKHINLQDYENFIRNFASTREPFPIYFSSLSLRVTSRGDKGHSLSLAPVPSKTLLNFHEELCEKLKETFVVHVEAGSWVPLVPIGFAVPDDKLLQALKLVFKLKFHLKGYVTKIGLAEFSHDIDVRTPLFSFALQGPPQNA